MKTINRLKFRQNAHERDALAAAVKTYRDHLNKFRQITKRAEKAELDDSAIESVKMLVINGVSISNAIKQISEDINKENTILKDSDNNLDIINVSELRYKP
jgi:predicted RNase H-like nuclease (RuvC/YqgF family)